MKNKITLPTKFGEVDFFSHQEGNETCIVAINESYDAAPFVRIHSSCVFSESFGTQDCDCAMQLDASIEYITKNGGIVIYLYQEGRGIGISNKIKAIRIQQEKGIDTASAFLELGHPPDPRNYDLAISALKSLGISTIRLGTNNPKKISDLEESGINVVDRVKLDLETTTLVEDYLKQKTKVLGHHEND